MREILFRGKRIDNGEWVYGFLSRLTEIRLLTKDKDVGLAYFIGYEVDIETVGQYTGVTDENNNRIFEDDVVAFSTDYTYTVLFREGSFHLYHTRLKSYFDESPLYWGTLNRAYNLYSKLKLRVIGNIHDNPELLTNKTE